MRIKVFFVSGTLNPSCPTLPGKKPDKEDEFWLLDYLDTISNHIQTCKNMGYTLLYEHKMPKDFGNMVYIY